MPKKSRESFIKRQKELKRMEKAQKKREKRLAGKEGSPPEADAADPAIEGAVDGPAPDEAPAED